MKIYEIKFNNAEGHTSDLHVRKAISYAFDYDALARIWSKRGVLMEGPLSAGMLLKTDDLKVYRKNLAKAKAELAKTPWPNGGFSLDFVYVTGLEEEHKTGEIIRDCLAELNIRVNIIPMVWADAVDSFKNPKTSPDMFPLYSIVYFDPDSFLWTGYHSSQAGLWSNPGHYKNPFLDGLLEKIRSSADSSEIEKLCGQARQVIVDDAASIFGVLCMDHHIFSPKVKNLKYCPIMGSEVNFRDLSLAD